MSRAGRLDAVVYAAQIGAITTESAREMLEAIDDPEPQGLPAIGRVAWFSDREGVLYLEAAAPSLRPGMRIRLTPWPGSDPARSMRHGELRVVSVIGCAVTCDRAIRSAIPSVAELDYVVADPPRVPYQTLTAIPSTMGWERQIAGQWHPCYEDGLPVDIALRSYGRSGPLRLKVYAPTSGPVTMTVREVGSGELTSFTDILKSEYPRQAPPSDPLDHVYDGWTLRRLLEVDDLTRREAPFPTANPFTPAQRAAVSEHWSAQLRLKLAAAAETERRQVVLDTEDD